MNDFGEGSAVGEENAYSVAVAYTERREPARNVIRALMQFGVREPRSVRRDECESIRSDGSAPREPEEQRCSQW
jgi:hypothetical protein